MSIKPYKRHTEINDLSSVFFEIGLALRLRKISSKEIERDIARSKLNEIIGRIENISFQETWDDSHISPGKRLKAALKIHELTQAELARKLAVPSQKINDLVQGRMNLTISWAKKIGRVLNINYKVLL